MGLKARKAKRVFVQREAGVERWYVFGTSPDLLNLHGLGRPDTMQACPEDAEKALGFTLKPGRRAVLEVRRVKTRP